MLASFFTVVLRYRVTRQIPANIEQRYATKFYVKLERTASETLQMLRTAYEDATLSPAQIFRRHKAFKEDRKNFGNEHHSVHIENR